VHLLFHGEPEDSHSRGAGATKKMDKGSLTYDGATAELKFAAVFIDQKDQDKPVVLVISDQKLRVEKWESEGFLLLPSNF
jgi:hypothetical protein